jgi:hypothetical protein
LEYYEQLYQLCRLLIRNIIHVKILGTYSNLNFHEF